MKVKDAWFILTDLGSLSVAIAAYKKRMGIEEMFRDCILWGLQNRRDWFKGRQTN
jgi:hypothetical protein